MKSENSILLRKFNIAPLTGVEQIQFARIDTDYIEQFNRIESLFTHATGGCLLVTGYRGVGKTTFINKVLHKASQELVEKNNTRLLTVHLNLARGYSTDKLLRRMVRELFFELDKNGIYDSMPENVKHQFLLAFLRTSNKMKQALSEGIKEAITKRTSQTDTRTNTYNLEPSVGIKDLSAALGSMEHSRQRSVTTETERTHENAWERGVELEFLEYDDEIAESDLSSLINTLNWYAPSIPEDTQPHRKYRRPEFFWKRMPTEYRILGKWLIRNYSETFSPTYKQQQFRVVFVLDEIDKMSLAQAEEIFRSLKNLFLQGNAFFVMIAGKDFYFHWRLNSTMEDDALFGLFTDVIHVPLFSDSEFKSMAESLVCTEGSPFPPELFTHLLYKAKGTPREFLRELTHFVSWDGDLLKLIGFDKGQVKLSQRLYPYIEKAYNQRIQEQQSIDTGMKDHLRRRLHNWLHAMVLKVVFTQEQILRIQSTRPQSQDNSASTSYETLLADGADDDLNALIQSLLAPPKPVLKVKQVLDNINFYTFTDEFNEYLSAVDTTGVGILRSESDQIQRSVLERLFNLPEMLRQGNIEEAQKILDGIPNSIMADTNLKEQIDALRKETWRMSQIQIISHLLEGNDFALAENRARSLNSEFSEKDDQVRLLFYEVLLKRAIYESKAAFTSEYEFKKSFQLISQIVEIIPNESILPANLSVLYKQLINLHMDFKKIDVLSLEGEGLLDKDWSMLQKRLVQLPETAKEYPPIAQLRLETDLIGRDAELLLSAKEMVSKFNLSGALDVLSRVTRKNKQLYSDARILIQSITTVLDLTKQIEQLYKAGDTKTLSKEIVRYENLAQDLDMPTEKIQEYKDWLLLQTQIDSLMGQVEELLNKGNLESAWDVYDEIKTVAKATVHKDVFRQLTNATLEKARKPAQALLEEAATKSQGGVVKASRGSSEGLFYQLQIDDVIQILDPLLQRDPQNARAQTLIDTLKSAIQIQ